ncbi:MAG TPA: GNAT family N-acetyltransferase [Anaerolineae bacterium]|nr:GNAT family N-acetyltransferase [Anaerolineae bacterium]
MPEFIVRPALSPDFAVLLKFKHFVDTDRVWQMDHTLEEGRISVNFREVRLPRSIHLAYPRSPDTLIERWKNLLIVLVSCVDGVPIGYIGVSSNHATSNVWIKDLVVHERWRRRGIATSLIHAVSDWGLERDLRRMTIEISSKNYPAIRLVQKIGFEFCGYNDYYYANNDIAIFFARYLP